MRKKLITISILIMLILAGLLALPVTSIKTTQDVTPTFSDNKPESIDIAGVKVTDVEIARLLDSITLKDIIDKIKESMNTGFQTRGHLHLLENSLNEGTDRLKKYGLNQDMTLYEVNEALTTGIFFNKKSDQYLPFMIDVLPTIARVFVYLEPMVYNLSEDNPSDTLVYKIEVFAKLIPFFDFVYTDHIGFFRTLSQSTFFFPAVGARLMLGPFTMAIIAFGPRIHWVRL